MDDHAKQAANDDDAAEDWDGDDPADDWVSAEAMARVFFGRRGAAERRRRRLRVLPGGRL